jgi:hypothetical protein
MNYLEIPQEKSGYFNVSDEAYFYFTNRIWDIERPTGGIAMFFRSEKLLVFCAFSATKIYGPYQTLYPKKPVGLGLDLGTLDPDPNPNPKTQMRPKFK